jgi:hypothetical protein
LSLFSINWPFCADNATQLSSLDRLLWVLLYRIWPQVIVAMVLVTPATVFAWHRKGFRFYWRWRSRRPGRHRISPEIRDLICRMSNANPLWGASRIHGELLKLDIKISQATVGRWMPWRPKVPSPTWRSFLRNHLPDITAIDMFVVAAATAGVLPSEGKVTGSNLVGRATSVRVRSGHIGYVSGVHP